MRTGSTSSSVRRRAFTLVELLIVITILALLLSITVYSVRFALNSDKAASGASRLQSFLAGARDRAIYTKSPIGVRLFLDSDDNVDASLGDGQRRTVSAMYYIDPGEHWTTEEQIKVVRWDPDLDGITNFPASGGANPDINGDGVPDSPALPWVIVGTRYQRWWELKRRGLLVDGVRIRIPAGPKGKWTAVDTRFIDITQPPTAIQALVLQIPLATEAGQNPRSSEYAENLTYELELPPSILPSEPALLAEDVVIDLDGSDLPTAWRPSTANGANFSQFMDIVFSPRGNVVGAASSTGLIHFYICHKDDSSVLKDEFIASLSGASHIARLATFESVVRGGANFIPADDIDPDAAPWVANLVETDGDVTDGDKYLTKDRRIVSLFTQTGSVTIHPVNSVDGDNDGLADDPFLFAEIGEENN